MVLTDKEKAFIENNFNEKSWNAYKIWKEHPMFEFSRMAVDKSIKKIKETWSTERRKGSSRHPLLQRQKISRRFLKSFFVRKKINLAPKIPSGKSHLGYRSASHQFIALSRKRISIATNV